MHCSLKRPQVKVHSNTVPEGDCYLVTVQKSSEPGAGQPPKAAPVGIGKGSEAASGGGTPLTSTKSKSSVPPATPADEEASDASEDDSDDDMELSEDDQVLRAASSSMVMADGGSGRTWAKVGGVEGADLQPEFIPLSLDPPPLGSRGAVAQGTGPRGAEAGGAGGGGDTEVDDDTSQAAVVRRPYWMTHCRRVN